VNEGEREPTGALRSCKGGRSEGVRIESGALGRVGKSVDTILAREIELKD